MTLTAAVIVFSISWWICFLAVLPIGVTGQWEDESTIAGTEPGAPKAPQLLMKAAWASVLSAAVTGAAAIAVPLLLAQ